MKQVIILPGPTGPTGTFRGVNILGTGPTGAAKNLFPTWAQYTGPTGVIGVKGIIERVYNIGPTGLKGEHETVIIPGFNGGGGVVGTTFDPASVLNVVLSNGNLTGANTSADFPTGCKGLLSFAKSTGLLYCEVTGLSDSGGSQMGFGFNSFNSTYDQQVTQGGAGGGIDLISKNSGGVFANGGSVGNLGRDIVPTDIIACAVDLGHMHVWFKNLTQPSTWNGNGGDPASNTGGFAITATPIVPFIGWGGGATLGVAVTANFVGPFVGTLPAGFSPWD
jgi:hypothetical protein